MSSQSSLPTKIISLGRRWRVPPPLTRNQEVRLISASLAHLWPLAHPAEDWNRVRMPFTRSYVFTSDAYGILIHWLDRGITRMIADRPCACHMKSSSFIYHARVFISLAVEQTARQKRNTVGKWTFYRRAGIPRSGHISVSDQHSRAQLEPGMNCKARYADRDMDLRDSNGAVRRQRHTDAGNRRGKRTEQNTSLHHWTAPLSFFWAAEPSWAPRPCWLTLTQSHAWISDIQSNYTHLKYIWDSFMHQLIPMGPDSLPLNHFSLSLSYWKNGRVNPFHGLAWHWPRSPLFETLDHTRLRPLELISPCCECIIACIPNNDDDRAG